MKKIITLTLTIAMLLGLTLPLTSCSTALLLSRMEETKRAYNFYSITDFNMNYASSAMYEQKMVMDATINGSAYKQTTEATVTFASDRNGLTLLEKSKTTVDVIGGGTVIYSDTGYVDGMMFSYAKEGGNETKLKSAVSLEDFSAYNQYRNSDAPAVVVDADRAKTVTCKQNEDKTWSATYEGFTAEGLVPFLYMLRGIDYYLAAEHDVIDVRMTVNADARLYPTGTKIEFIFAENPDTQTAVPVVTLETTYYGWNSTTPEAYDISSFNEVDDLRAMHIFLDALLDKSYEESGKVDITTVSAVTTDGYDTTQTNKQTLTFDQKDALTFDLITDNEAFLYKMNYSDGEFLVRIFDPTNDSLLDTTTEPMTYVEARATIAQLMDPEGLTSRSIKDVEMIDAEAGICRFTLSDAFKNAYKEEYEAAGVTLSAFKGYCEATIADGELTSYRFHMEMTLRISGESIKSVVDMTISFSSVSYGAETV